MTVPAHLFVSGSHNVFALVESVLDDESCSIPFLCDWILNPDWCLGCEKREFAGWAIFDGVRVLHQLNFGVAFLSTSFVLWQQLVSAAW
jgi:hypothetical protein